MCTDVLFDVLSILVVFFYIIYIIVIHLYTIVCSFLAILLYILCHVFFRLIYSSSFKTCLQFA